VIYAVAFSPDSQTLASTMAVNGLIHLWDLQTFTLKQTLRDHTKMTTGVAFSPDGKLLTSVTGWGYNSNDVAQIFLWDLVPEPERSGLNSPAIIPQWGSPSRSRRMANGWPLRMEMD
jgi:WD40 repeat protein